MLLVQRALDDVPAWQIAAVLDVATLAWGAVLYLIAFITAGVMTIRNGHVVLFILGFLLPILWIVGAFMDRPRY